MMKRMISSLLSAQHVLQSARTAKMHSEWKSATPDWETAKVQEGIMVREQYEKFWLIASERSRVFGIPMPQFYEGIDYGPHSARVAALFSIGNGSPAVAK
jgi:hypothetical protein